MTTVNQSTSSSSKEPIDFLWVIADGRGLAEERRPLLFVLPEDVATYWRPRRKVLECSTWGEVRALDTEVHAELLGMAGHGSFDEFTANFDIVGEAPGLKPSPVDEAEQLLISLEDLPDDEESFAPYDDVSAIADHDWPPAVYRLLATSVPEEIIRAFGVRWMTTINGDFASFEADMKDSVLKALSRRRSRNG